MKFTKRITFLIVAATVFFSCSSDDKTIVDPVETEETTITELSIVTNIENPKGNEISVVPTSKGGTLYAIDFGDTSVSDNSDVLTSSGDKVNYSYPETDATYTIKVTASASNATDVSIQKDVTIDYKEDVVETKITNLNFSTSVANNEGNKINLTPSSTGGTLYTIDFGDTSVTDDSDIVTSDGASVSYTYPETDATYTINVTASASNATDVSLDKDITINYTPIDTSNPFDLTKIIDFELNSYGSNWAWNVFENDDNPDLEFVSNPDASGINTSDFVAKITARKSGAAWVGTESVHGEMGITWDLSASNAIIKIMVYKTVISDVGIKLANPAGGAQAEIKVANTKINEWEELSFDFSSRIGNGLDGSTNIDQIVVFPDFNLSGRTSDTVTYFDNIRFTSK